MPQAIVRAVRERIVKRRARGESVGRVAQAEQVSPRSVRRVYHAWQAEGEAGLHPHYEAQTARGPRFGAAVYAEAVAMKHQHPRWGAGLIRLELREQHAHTPLPAERTLQVWFRRAGVSRRGGRMVRAFRGRGECVHAVWEMDAKEHVYLADGSGHSVVSVQDEYSGAALGARSFPPRALGASAGRGHPGVVAQRLRGVGPAGLLAGG